MDPWRFSRPSKPNPHTYAYSRCNGASVSLCYTVNSAEDFEKEAIEKSRMEASAMGEAESLIGDFVQERAIECWTGSQTPTKGIGHQDMLNQDIQGVQSELKKAIDFHQGVR